MDRFAAVNSPETLQRSPRCVSVSRSARPTWPARSPPRRIRSPRRRGAPRGVLRLYIGDGMSTANLLGSDAIHPIVDRLTSQHVPVSSYAIGPRVDTQLLACLANQTGGVMAVDGENYTGRSGR